MKTTDKNEFVNKKITEMMLMLAIKDRGDLSEEQEREFLANLRAEVSEYMKLHDH